MYCILLGRFGEEKVGREVKRGGEDREGVGKGRDGERGNLVWSSKLKYAVGTSSSLEVEYVNPCRGLYPINRSSCSVLYSKHISCSLCSSWHT